LPTPVVWHSLQPSNKVSLDTSDENFSDVRRPILVQIAIVLLRTATPPRSSGVHATQSIGRLAVGHQHAPKQRLQKARLD
jgi:hypothetical protein